MTRDDALAAWERLLLEEGKVAARTLDAYRQVLRRLGGTIPLTDPPEQVASALLAYRAGLQQRFDNNQISRSLIRLHVAAVRSFYRTLVKAGSYPSDPTTQLRSIASEEGVPRPMTSQQVDQLFSAVDLEEPDGLRDLVMLWLYYHSLRNTEVANLTTAQVVYSARDESVYVRFKAKGQTTRVVVLVPEAAEALAALLLRQFAPEDWDHGIPDTEPGHQLLRLELLLDRVLKGTPLRVFWHGKSPMTRRQSNRVFVKYRERAGLGVGVGPHSLRHTCATNLLEADVDLFTVKEILGHRSLRQTQNYTKVLTTKKRRAMNRLPRPTMSGS
jgi:site-specific recombinase XerD